MQKVSENESEREMHTSKITFLILSSSKMCLVKACF